MNDNVTYHNPVFRLSSISREPRAFVVWGDFRFWLPVCRTCKKTPLFSMKNAPHELLHVVGFCKAALALREIGIDSSHWAEDECLQCSGSEPEIYI